MRPAALALAVLLVLLAGVVPAGMGILRAFRTDEVEFTDGKVLRGSVLSETAEGVRLATDGKTVDGMPGEVREVRRASAWSGAHVAKALGDPFTWEVLGWTAGIALLGALGAVLLGLPFAVLTARTDVPGRGFFSAFYAAPLVLPPLLTAMAWDAVLPAEWRQTPGALGALGPALQASALFALAYFPFVALFARRSLAAVGASEEEAALLAAGPWRALRRVTLPLARPGILLGALFAFVFCLNDFSVVDYLNLFSDAKRQVPVFPYLIQIEFSRHTKTVEDLLALGLPLTLLSLGIAIAAVSLATRTPTATVGGSWRPPRPIPLGPAGRFAGALFCGAVLAAGALVPAAALLFEAGGPSTYARVFGQGGAQGSLRLTLGVAAAATLMAAPAALVLAEAGRRLGRGAEGFLGALALLPLALVPALVPLGSMFLWNRPSLALTRDGVPWNPVYDTAVLPALVVFSRVFPFALGAAWAALREVEPSQHDAAEVTGVPWDLRLRKVLLPLVRPGVALGALLAFVFAVRELDALAVLGSDTLVHRLWAALHFRRDETVAAMAVVLLALLGFAFGAAAATGWLRPRVPKP